MLPRVAGLTHSLQRGLPSKVELQDKLFVIKQTSSDDWIRIQKNCVIGRRGYRVWCGKVVSVVHPNCAVGRLLW